MTAHARRWHAGKVSVWQGKDGAVIATSIGRGWIIVPRDVWDAFAEAVKRGDYDRT